MMSAPSKFFPPPYRPDIDGPPLSILDAAKQKLLHITQRTADPTPHIQDHQHQLALLTDSPGYAAFFITSLDLYERLLNAKPVLIQGTSFLLQRLKGFHFTLTLHVIQNASQMTHGSCLSL
jgi:hypothetical protein